MNVCKDEDGKPVALALRRCVTPLSSGWGRQRRALALAEAGAGRTPFDLGSRGDWVIFGLIRVAFCPSSSAQRSEPAGFLVPGSPASTDPEGAAGGSPGDGCGVSVTTSGAGGHQVCASQSQGL